MAYEEVQAENFTNNNFFTGGLRKRLVLVLDCVTPHDFEYASFSHVQSMTTSRSVFICFCLYRILFQPKIVGIHQFATVFDQSQETTRIGSAQNIL